MKRQRILRLAFVLLITTPMVAHATTVRTVALKGQHAPGMPGGVNYHGFTSPALNSTGQTAFFADLDGDFSLDSLWSEDTASLALVARIGAQAPGLPSGVNYTTFDDTNHPPSPLLNAAGRTAFWAKSANAQIDPFGIWSEGSGSLNVVAHSLSHAPGTPADFVFNDISSPVLNSAGQTAFFARPWNYDEVSEGIWKESASGLALVARDGNHAPGTPVGVSYQWFGSPVLNAAGQTAFGATLTGSGVEYDSGIWSEGSGELALVARKGDHAPGMSVGVTFDGFDISFQPPVLNAAGQTAFVGYMAGSGVDITNDQGIWSEGSGDLELVVRRGSQAPGTPSGVNFDALSAPVLNSAGSTAFRAYLTGSGVDSTNDTGIWSEGSGGVALVAREGEQAAGMPSGVEFISMEPPTLNAAGQVAFAAELTGGSYGIWATDVSGELKLVAGTGQMLEVAPGVFREISSAYSIGNTGNGDGRASAFNDSGQLAFVAAFTDSSSGVFISNRVAHLPGDFNGDGTVDAADYVVWRKNPGGIYTQDDYNTWRANFGRTFFTGSAAVMPFTDPLSPAVPEPTWQSMLVISLVAAGLLRQRSIH